MKRLIIWLLPVVDLFALKRILQYYRTLGVEVPWRHAKIGMVERWAGYLPLGFIVGWLRGFWAAMVVILIVGTIFGSIELYLMHKGTRPWKFFKDKPFKLVGKIFLLEIYNVVGYYTLGAALGSLIRM